MKEYKTSELRNVVLMGHSASGKTILADAMLYASGQISRIGTIQDGSTVSDYAPEEMERQISIRSSLVHVEWKDHKINVIDTPGFMDFAGEVKGAMHVADGAVITVSGTAGIEIGTEFSWNYAQEKGIPACIVVTELDKEHTKFEDITATLKERFSSKIIPLTFPVNEGPAMGSVVDVVAGKLLTFDDKGKASVGDLPADLKAKAEELREAFVETVAESDDELIEKFFDEGTLSDEEIQAGFKKAVLGGNLFPVFAVASQKMIGVSPLLDLIVSRFPDPSEAGEIELTEGGDSKMVKVDPAGTTSLQIFKSVHEHHIGDMSYFKVMSGTLTAGTDMKNNSNGDSERFGTLYVLNGKERKEVPSMAAGDLGATVKLKSTHVNNTLAVGKFSGSYKEIKFPEPVIRSAVETKSKGDDEKIGVGLAQVVAEDPTFHYAMDPELKQTIVSGLGEIHLEVSLKKIKERYNIDIDMIEPKVPYRETIRKSATARYRHKKQSGGAGQFGEVEMRIEPKQRGAGVEFVSELVGQNVDRAFVPSIEKGVRQACDSGPLSGNLVIDVKAAVFDGKQHPVDSKDIAFQIAGRGAFRDAFVLADPVLLEPIYEVEITVPEDYMGDVMGDVSSRRGKVLGMDSDGHFQIIRAEIPLANLYKYSTVLRSITQGRAFHRRKFSKYEVCPRDVQEKIVEEYKKHREEGN